MQGRKYRYFAFISYSHMDKQLAHELQQFMESYRLPVELGEKYPLVPRDLKPLFRDEENLGAGHLDSNIKSALGDSRFLIVICSKNSATPNKDGRHYVNDEVYYFLGDAPEENALRIIPVIHRSHAAEDARACMPPILRLLNILGIDALAKGQERCFNDVVASMLGLDPKELWEHRNSLCAHEAPPPSDTPQPPLGQTGTWRLVHTPPTQAQLDNVFKLLLYICANLFNYNGRACRKEFWMGCLALILVHIAVFLLFFAVCSVVALCTEAAKERTINAAAYGTLLPLAVSCIALPSMTCRRFHDIGLSGWFQLLFFLWLPFSLLPGAALCCLRGKDKENKYGPSPLPRP